MNDTLSLPDVLRAALAGVLDGLPPKQATQAVDRLISNYRGTTPTDAPVLRDRSDVAAYAAYRMPATFEAVRSALGALREAAPGWAPGTHVDVGGGTGAASWAVSEAWGEQRSTVVDWAEPALALGRELAEASGVAALKGVVWQRSRIGAALTIESSDLVTVSYVLKELTEADRDVLVDQVARAARGAVVLVEPGTPDGYRRILAARERLIGAGLRIAAPCPDSGACPIGADSTNWCHFSARVSRSSLHRKVKGGSLAYEDEKFAYVVAVRPDVVDAVPVEARIVRKPQLRKGLVMLELCRGDESAGEGGPLVLAGENVSKKRHGELYRAARDADWGDAWPPPSGSGQR
ncbi:small ribosomal subunit Rsm22 family protein [Streptomyces sp. NBC_00237]|uniref:small ribosomal subunit Rsm22 family protein n=1 Tax=Streptomyces sp. NBC_00237 TaxID=2975687 RepID=UPI002252D6BE|nr:small ribosomal subunit Rsm22 family protein [Streptomyces sp. NBC_00237]MCX5201579.1 small ribosomal subunit Rsm22 family protein [Streptomyces sp. NBC_00237]